ncbi:MAG: hypothetical protein HUU20_02715 [Pirellulales bacterium]|nr:hypothetical protein [Pirellulales bacterium]
MRSCRLADCSRTAGEHAPYIALFAGLILLCGLFSARHGYVAGWQAGRLAMKPPAGSLHP